MLNLNHQRVIRTRNRIRVTAAARIRNRLREKKSFRRSLMSRRRKLTSREEIIRIRRICRLALEAEIRPAVDIVKMRI